MKGYRFLVCCVLVLTIYELGGATATVVYKFDPIESILNETDLHINVFLISSETLEIDNKLTFSVTLHPVNPALTILSSSYEVSAKKMDTDIGYSGGFDVSVAALPGPDGVLTLTGDLSATLSCDHPILCKIEDKTEVETKVIVKETKTLSVTATPSYDVSQTSPTANVTVTLSKDLATLENITISVSLQDPQGQHYTNQSVLASGADNSSRDVVFTNIQWGDYQLIIGCGNNSVCSALSQWIHFPEPVSVPAHPSYSELGATMFGFKKTVADYKAVQDALKADYDNLKEVNKHLQERVYFLSSNLTNMISALRAELHNVTEDPSPTAPTAKTTISTIESTTITEQTITPMTTSIPDDNNTTTGASDGSDTSDTSDAGDASDDSDTSDAGDAPSQTTRYMEFAVGGLIAALVCGLLGYLLYHYRTTVKEWICSKKVVVSNLPIARKLRRNAGSRYSKLPRTMQEALHQD